MKLQLQKVLEKNWYDFMILHYTRSMQYTNAIKRDFITDFRDLLQQYFMKVYVYLKVTFTQQKFVRKHLDGLQQCSS